MEFVGVLVSSDGYRPLPDNVTGITEFKVPECRRDLLRFLGMANYYHSFGPNFAVLAAPLCAVTSPGRTYTWLGCALRRLRKVLTL